MLSPAGEFSADTCWSLLYGMPSQQQAVVGCGAGGEVQLTDALNLLCLQRAFYGCIFEGQHYDTSDPIGYLKANIDLPVHEFQQPLRSTCRA